MKRIVICGCGHFGKNITKHLLRYESYITVIDQDKELVKHMSNTFDVKGIHGFVSHPETLKEAGQTDILIAATSMDEINMVACEVAHALFDTPLKMARVRSQTYFTSQYDLIFQDKNLSIDEILSPEIDAADYVTKTLSVPGSNDVISFDIVDIIVVTLDAGAPACHTQVDGLPRLLSEGDVEILAIHRAEETFLPQSNTTLLPGDEVYFLCQTESIEKSVLLFKKTASPTNRIILFGGGNFGFALGQKLESTFDHKEITVIEPLESQARFLAENFNKINVICGDLFDHDLLKEVDINNADVVACTSDDKVNLLSALLAKKLGAKRALSLISTASYEPLVRSIGINGVCNPHTLTASKIIQRIRTSWARNVFIFEHGFGEFMRIIVRADVAGTQIKSIESPGRIKVAGIIREGKLHLGQNYILESNDEVIISSTIDGVCDIEKLFSRP